MREGPRTSGGTGPTLHFLAWLLSDYLYTRPSLIVHLPALVQFLPLPISPPHLPSSSYSLPETSPSYFYTSSPITAIMSARPQNIGIKAIEVYFPRQVRMLFP
jgi:hypothetical protein